MATASEIRAQAQAAVAEMGAPALGAEALTAVAPNAQVAQLQDQLAQAMQMIAQQAAQLQFLKPAPVEKVELKLYYSALPFINVPIMRAPGYCENVTFVGGRLETADPAVQAVLNAAIAAGGSGFSHGPIIGEASDVTEMKADIMSLAAAAQGKMVAAGQATG